jgi:hypothetical protein
MDKRNRPRHARTATPRDRAGHPSRPWPSTRPMMLFAAVIAALTIISQAGAGQTTLSPLRTDPAGSAPPMPGLPTPGPEPVAGRPSSAAPDVATSHHSASASAAVRVTPALLGAPDFAGYCRATGQGTVHLVAANAYGWRCSADNGTGDDAQAVCSWTYHTQRITNRVTNFNDPTSWQCWRATRRLGTIDFTAYCVATGHPSARMIVAGQASAVDAYSWYCVDDNNGIDTQDACRQLYHSAQPISRFQNFYDANSWECWG